MSDEIRDYFIEVLNLIKWVSKCPCPESLQEIRDQADALIRKLPGVEEW